MLGRISAMCAATAVLASTTPGSAVAEVIAVAANGFEVHESIHVAAASDKAYAALLTPAAWWSSDHTFSKNAGNLVLDAHVGGCWCEKLPDGGSAEHLRVVYVSPGKMLRMRGALGPFQGLAVDGAMTWSVKSVADGSDIEFTYSLGGFAREGFDAFAKAADRVLAEQIERLRKLVDAAAVTSTK